MTIALIILAVVAAAVIGLLIYASMQPDTFRVERSAIIHAPREKIIGIVTDLRRGVEWSPFEKGLTMKKTFSGPATGVGSALEWDGDKQSGAGKFTIAAVTPSKITFNLDMTKPMKANHIVEYTFEPQGDATRMTWSIHGRANMMSKVMGLFMNVDKMCGDQFEKGFKDLKIVAEREAESLPDGSRTAAA
ncbi:SRPBCC family protein [Pseudorhodoplanes sinuspersici]|uniref:Uncharacterized protein n=1 Tax=Pseudorhodoplanes sinuspersici TaxID=1235591 RepID=A0A1W6ZR13_9HYPH|nr:SRPBCC family protein [Pseudorhodoplanes sinuspersici]ARP99725.1 hypothetical protein CAK95_11980 [Pseudorhodoplanes sinuspersici]RKE70713.1 polyketide cyclase/dehydrase/lipid transport protein [Pseudorhodoplanes sinuspersici]